jgi:hypothetical protein
LYIFRDDEKHVGEAAGDRVTPSREDGEGTFQLALLPYKRPPAERAGDRFNHKITSLILHGQRRLQNIGGVDHKISR